MLRKYQMIRKIRHLFVLSFSLEQFTSDVCRINNIRYTKSFKITLNCKTCIYQYTQHCNLDFLYMLTHMQKWLIYSQTTHFENEPLGSIHIERSIEAIQNHQNMGLNSTDKRNKSLTERQLILLSFSFTVIHQIVTLISEVECAVGSFRRFVYLAVLISSHSHHNWISRSSLTFQLISIIIKGFCSFI